MHVLLGRRGIAQPGTLVGVIVQLWDGHEFQARDRVQDAPHVLDDAVHAVMFMQRHTLVHGLHKVLL